MNASHGRRRAGRRARFALRAGVACFVALLAARAGHAQVLPLPGGQEAVNTKDEPFEKTDPYTKGDEAAMDRAGYVSYGPFPLAKGIKTSDIEETLGGLQVLWVETAHFKLGSTLKTYKFQGDQREEKRIKEELARLKPRFDKFAPPRGKLDPWLRLHLAALRLEEQYADFQKRFGISDADFDPTKRAADAPDLGHDPYLGLPLKFTVLLLEKESGLSRVARRYLQQEPKTSIRWRLDGGTQFLCATAEGVRNFGYTLDAALASLVAGEMAHNLLDAVRDGWTAAPMWFRYGLSHVYARKVDERFAIHAAGTTRELGDDSWKWEERVGRLLANGFVKPWSEFFEWVKYDAPRPQSHMLAWSRVTWLLQRKDGDPRQLLHVLCEPILRVPEPERPKAWETRTRAALQAAYGKDLETLDAEWREWVGKTYPR